MLNIKFKDEDLQYKDLSWNLGYSLECPLFIVLHEKDIVYYFVSLLIDSGHFQLTSTIPTISLIVELVVNKHNCFYARTGNIAEMAALCPTLF